MLSQSKYSLIKQNAATYFGDYANAFRATGHKYFGQTHNGTFDKTQFGKDVSTAFSAKYPPVQTPAASKLLIKSWDTKKETLVDYMHQMGVSENAAPYVLEAQNYVVSSFDASKKSLTPEDMTQIVADISKGMDKIEAKVEQDKALSENEVVAVLIATTAAKSLTGAIAEVSKDFFQNLDLTNSRNPIVLRCWLCSFARTWFNVVATVVVRSFSVIYVGTYVHEFLTTAVGPFAQSCIDGGCNADILFVNLGRVISYIEYDLTHYNCYLPDDLWQC